MSMEKRIREKAQEIEASCARATAREILALVNWRKHGRQ